MCAPYKSGTCFYGGTRWSSWLRHCTTSRKVAGSIPDGVTEIFHWHNTSGRTMTLGLTQPLTEMSTRNVSCGRCVGLTTLPSSCADCLEIWEPQLPGTLRACPGLYSNCFSFTCTCLCEIWDCLSSKHKHHYSPKCDTVWVCTALFFMLDKVRLHFHEDKSRMFLRNVVNFYKTTKSAVPRDAHLSDTWQVYSRLNENLQGTDR